MKEQMKVFRMQTRLFWLAGCYILACGGAAGAEWQYGAWSRDVVAAKREAYLANRPLVVMISNLQSCGYCISAWDQVLCDGGVHHRPATCTANDAGGGYGVHPLAAYAAEKKLVLLELDPNSAGELAHQVYLDYRHSFSIQEYPSITVFHVREEADLDDGGINALAPTQVDPVTGFTYRGGKTVNGIATPPQTALTFDNFRTILESFFPNAHWQMIAPPVAGGYEDAVDLGRFPGEGYPPEPGEFWRVITPKVGGYNLDGENNEVWFKFTAVAMKRYFFIATSITAPPGISVDCSVFAGFDSIPYEPAIRATSGQGFSRLDRGFYVDIDTAGTYFLRVSRRPDPTVTGTNFVLRAHETVYDPPVGSPTNPQWSGAVPGQWTMDWEAAQAAARAEGRPLLVVFSGLRWCPWCIGMENQTTGSPQFIARSDDAYLVLVDNRNRGEVTGPVLLLDDYPGGYLDSNAISQVEAAAKMQANIDLQNQLAAPGADTSLGYARIGYPTLLYLRPDGSVVGRVSYLKLQNAEETAACLDQLAALVPDSGEELDNFASPTGGAGRSADFADFVTLPVPAQHGDGQEKPAKIGTVDERDWRVFSPAEIGDTWHKTAWLFSLRVPEANPQAQATLAVYDASGEGAADGNLLATGSGSLTDGVTLEFIPSASAGHRLLVAVSGLDEVVDYSLRYATREVNNLIAFTVPVFTAVQTSPTAVATVGLTVETPNEGPLAFSYRAEEIIDGAVAGVHFATVALDPATFTVDPAKKIDGITFDVAVPLTGQGRAPWSGSRDFRVLIAPQSNCWIPPAGAAATVKIYSLPAFGTESTATETAQYVPLTPLVLPVFDGLGGVLEVAATGGELPLGVEWHYSATGPHAGQVVIRGTPAVSGDFSLTLEAADDLDGTHTAGDTITVEIRVKPLSEINPHGVPGIHFAGALLDDPENPGQAEVVVGRVSLVVGELGELSAVVGDRDGSVVCTADGWNDIDEWGALRATLVSADPVPTELHLTLAPDGSGVGQYLAPTREARAVDLLPVPWSAEHAAAEYDGFYTVGLAVAAASRGQGPYQGAGYLSFTVGNLGDVTFQGQLSDGTVFSGSGELTETPGGADRPGRVTLFSPLYTGQGAFGGLFQIVPKSRRQLDDACVLSGTADSYWRQAVVLLTSSAVRTDTWRIARPGEDIGIDPGEWTVYADSPGMRHSPGTTLAIAPTDLVARVFASADWRSGWNLIAMPDWKWIDQTSAATILERWPVWGMDAGSGRLMPAQTLLPGRAYWFRVAEENIRELPGISGVAWPQGEPSTNWQPTPAWSLTAKPADWSGVDCGWRWNGRTYLRVTPETELPPETGGWFHVGGTR